MKKILRFIAPGILLLNFKFARAQQFNCGTEIPSQQWEGKFQQLIENAKNQAGKSPTALYTIPVIIHVLHGGQAIGAYPNLAQGQLNSQVQVLNDDYAGAGLYNSNYPATAFTTWATNQALPAANKDGAGRVKIANCNVQFCLATKDTLGNTLAEPGIDRVNYVSKGWSDPASMTSYNAFKSLIDGTIKPGTIWNVSKYLNIWVTDENLTATGGLLGYATFPPLSTLPGLSGTGTSTTDGFWCYAKVFGSAITYSAGTYYGSTYNKGRTCTHEIGHYLGLRHIWGDGACLTDYCNDTPPGAASNAGTPSYPYHVGTCTTSPSNSPNGEMFMNFMDYTNDNGKYMFTVDQSTRIQTAMANSPYRKFLGTHGLCSVSSAVATASFNAPAALCINTAITLTNTSSGSPTPTYTWSAIGSATFSPGVNAINPTVYFATAGTYTINLAASNGTTSSISKTVTVIAGPAVTVNNPVQAICAGESATLSASGANSYAWSSGGNTATVTVSPLSNTVYSVTGTTGACSTVKTTTVTVNFLPTVMATISRDEICEGEGVALNGTGAISYNWQPVNMNGASINYTPTASQTYTCFGTDANGCQNTSVVSVIVSACTGVMENANGLFSYAVFPNPAKDKITLRINAAVDLELATELRDVLGKVVMKQKYLFTKDKNALDLDITTISNGIYFIKLTTKDGSSKTLKLVKE